MQISTLQRFSKAIWPRFPTRWSHCISECSALQSEISIHLIRVLNALKCLKFQELASIFKATSSIFSRPLFWQLHMVAPWCCHFHALQVILGPIMTWTQWKESLEWHLLFPVFKLNVSSQRVFIIWFGLDLGFAEICTRQPSSVAIKCERDSFIKAKNLITTLVLLSTPLTGTVMEKTSVLFSFKNPTNNPGTVNITPFNLILKIIVKQYEVKDCAGEQHGNGAVIWELQMWEQLEKKELRQWSGIAMSWRRESGSAQGKGLWSAVLWRIAASSHQLCLERLIETQAAQSREASTVGDTSFERSVLWLVY